MQIDWMIVYITKDCTHQYHKKIMKIDPISLYKNSKKTNNLSIVVVVIRREVKRIHMV